MKTKFHAGLFSDGNDHVYQAAPNEDGYGWSAYRVDEIIQRTSSGGGVEHNVIRAAQGHLKLTIELWHTFTPVEFPIPPSAARLRQLAAVMSGAADVPRSKPDEAGEPA